MNNPIIATENTGKRKMMLFACLLFLAVFSLAFRYLTSGTVESGGDAVYKWSVIKQFVLFGDVPARLNHHTCRWSVNIPVFFLQKYLGTGPTTYYVWPFLTSTLSAIFGFLLMERLRSWRIGLAAGVLIIMSDPMMRQGTQLLPMGTAVSFLLGAVYFFVRWRDDGCSRNIAASSLLLFFAYGAKITIIYYVPAFLVLIYLFAGNLRTRFYTSLCFLGIFIALFVVETYSFNMLTGSSFGRMELIQSSHRPIRTIASSAITNDWQYSFNSVFQYLCNFFVYFKYPGRAPAVLYYIAFVISVFALAKKWPNTSAAAIPFLFGFFGHAYAVTSVFPFVRPERILFRYQSAIFELALLTLVLFLSAPRFKGTATKYKLPFKAGDRAIRIILFLVLASPIAISAIKHIHWVDNGYKRTARTAAIVRQAREDKVPVFILREDEEKESIKQIIKYYALYTDTHYFGQVPWNREHDIRLSDFPAIERDGKEFLMVERNGHTDELDGKAIYLERF
ncbi:ArnT family glycosyltransferase [Desulfovibrio sp. Fe33]|uniref:ArnT family glycosyltransferase n=1 Tax=Desulfovibrio sp. Fe33 TaxID=3020842 RepID=UPI00234E1DDE|nr:hypothetical protein [Desulfovibrio sp. Fe33]